MNHIAPNFQKAQRLASKLLSKQQQLTSLYINVQELAFDFSIQFDSMQNYCRLVGKSLDDFGFNSLNNGCLITLSPGNFLILYNETHSIERINWTLAHEIGHIYLNHQNDGNIEEVEAHFFAAQLLMPEIVLLAMSRKLEKITTDIIYTHFLVSREAAHKRIQTLNRKCAYTWTTYDQLILEHFKHSIDLICSSIKNHTIAIYY